MEKPSPPSLEGYDSAWLMFARETTQHVQREEIENSLTAQQVDRYKAALLQLGSSPGTNRNAIIKVKTRHEKPPGWEPQQLNLNHLYTLMAGFFRVSITIIFLWIIISMVVGFVEKGLGDIFTNVIILALMSFSLSKLYPSSKDRS